MTDIDGENLTAADIVALAERRESCAVTEEARRWVGRSHAFAERVSATRPIYGRSTGVGANRSIGIEDAGTYAHARALLRSHATSAGHQAFPHLGGGVTDPAECAETGDDNASLLHA